MANNSYKISLGVDLKTSDIAKRISDYNKNKSNPKVDLGINLDTKNLISQINKLNPTVQVGVRLNDQILRTQLNGLNTTPVDITLHLNTQDAINRVNNLRQQLLALNNISINLGGGNGGRRVSDAFAAYQRASREISSFYKQIEKMELSLNSLTRSGIDSQHITDYRTRLDQLRRTYEILFSTIHNGNINTINLDSVLSDINQARTSIAELSSFIENTRTKRVVDIKTNIDNGKLQGQINSITQQFSQLGIVNDRVSNDIVRLQSLLNNMDASDDVELVTRDYEEFLSILQLVKTNIASLQAYQRNVYGGESLDLRKESALLKLNNLFEQGSQAAKKFRAEVENLSMEINECNSLQGMQNIDKKISNLGQTIAQSNLRTHTVGSNLRKQLSKYSGYLSIASAITYSFQAMRSMSNQVKAIDTAMTELKKVTNETSDSYNKFLGNAASKAKELGTTIEGYVSSTADFARLGYGFEESQGLAEVANVYAVVGDEIDGVEGATQSLISTLAAFRDEVSGISDTDFAMEIIDKFNEVSNNFAISSGGIGEAMERSASSLRAANNTIDESIAMITAANEVTQNPEKVGKIALPT